MKKYLFCVYAVIISLSFISCSDDKDPAPPALKKLSKVTITKNNDNTTQQTLVITYNQSGQIANIKTNNVQIDDYSYDGNNIVVNSIKTNSSGTGEISKIRKIKYQTSGNQITREEESLYNPYINDEEYISNIYLYQYTRSLIGKMTWNLARWPLEDGKYQTAPSTDIGEYIWDNQNITRYRYLPKSIMEFEYSEDLQPSNYPFKIFRTLRPVGLETFSPVNLMMGSTNKNRIKRAYWYNVPDVTNICAEYLFSYDPLGDYITTTTITEKIYPASGEQATENIYKVTFEYNQ